MLSEVYKEAKNENDNTHEIDTLILVSSMIEERISSNNSDSVTEGDSIYFDKIRELVVDIYQLYALVKRSEVKYKHVEYMLDDLNLLSQIGKENIDNIIEIVEEHIVLAKGIKNKIIFESIRGVVFQIKEIKKVENVSFSEIA